MLDVGTDDGYDDGYFLILDVGTGDAYLTNGFWETKKGLACKSFFPFFHFFCRLRKRQLLPSILPHSNQGRILGRSSHFQLFGCFRPAQPTGGILQPRFFSVAHVTRVPVTGIDGRIDCSAWRLWICCIVSHLCDFCQMGKVLTPANTAR